MNDEIENLIKEVRQTAYELHVYLGNGLLEKVYENGLRHRLERAGFNVQAQKPLTVYDDDGIIPSRQTVFTSFQTWRTCRAWRFSRHAFSTLSRSPRLKTTARLLHALTISTSK